MRRRAHVNCGALFFVILITSYFVRTWQEHEADSLEMVDTGSISCIWPIQAG